MTQYHAPEEFSLQLSWTPRVNGKIPATPGFYLRAAFANEGTAMGVVKGSFDNGRCGNGSLADDAFLIALFELMDAEGLLQKPFNADLGRKLADHAHARQVAQLAAKRARLESLREEIAALEAEVG
jgi:hypothetical protein